MTTMNREKLLNIENWVKYLELAREGGLTDVAIANDIVAHINEALSISDVVGRSEQLIANEKDAFDRGYTKGWTEGYNSGKVNDD